jgi:DNA-binding MarR family transcriptional regulator
MKKSIRKKTLKLSWEEIGYISEGLVAASRPLRLATQSITDQYSLGPRGAWMVHVISRGGIYPLDLTHIFEIGRSLITAELNRLAEAKLISYTQSKSDGRRIELRLTALGERVNRRVKTALIQLVTQRLAGYTREQVQLCTQMLRDFREPPTARKQKKSVKPVASKKK